MLIDKMRHTGKGRIVMVSSRLHRLVRTFDLDNLNSEKSWESYMNYPRTKLANLLFAKELQRRLEAAGLADVITVNSVHPGVVRTALQRSDEKVWYWKILFSIHKFFLKVCGSNPINTMIYDKHFKTMFYTS